MTEFMIDIETLGTKPGSPILQIGVCSFELSGDGPIDKAQCHVIPESCLAVGLIPDWDTICWWSRQNKEARDLVFSRVEGALPLVDALERLRARVKGKGGLWANSPSFDMVLLEAAYRSVGAKLPWQFWRFRDQRTYVEASGLNKDAVPKPEGFIEHHAAWDADWQVRVIQAAWRRLQ